jgi:hypothetical protein
MQVGHGDRADRRCSRRASTSRRSAGSSRARTPQPPPVPPHRRDRRWRSEHHCIRTSRDPLLCDFSDSFRILPHPRSTYFLLRLSLLDSAGHRGQPCARVVEAAATPSSTHTWQLQPLLTALRQPRRPAAIAEVLHLSAPAMPASAPPLPSPSTPPGLVSWLRGADCGVHEVYARRYIGFHFSLGYFSVLATQVHSYN